MAHKELTEKLHDIIAPEAYKLHHLALLPLVAENTKQSFAVVHAAISSSGEDDFLNFILQQGLGGLWHKVLKESVFSAFSSIFTNKLRSIALLNAANYLQQQYMLKNVEKIFKDHSIPYAVFKGAHIRELSYSQPAVRPACDIDILVSETDKIRVICALTAHGLIFHPEAKNISHEASLSKNNVTIDLHWNLLRPGRTRENLTEEFLHTRQEYSGQYGLCNEATLFIMLVHPVFAKYATAPQASLVRVVDLVRWVEKRNIDWDKLQDWLIRGGVQTAAWITAEWLAMLTGFTLPEPFLQKIKPGKFRSLYLQKWITCNYSSCLLNYPILIQAGLTLPAHDRFSDACRAVSSLIREKRAAAEKMLRLQDECT